MQCGHVLGMRLSDAVPLVSLLAFRPNFLVRFLTSAVSLASVAINASLMVVSIAIADVSCSNKNLSVVAAAARLSK